MRSTRIFRRCVRSELLLDGSLYRHCGRVGRLSGLRPASRGTSLRMHRRPNEARLEVRKKTRTTRGGTHWGSPRDLGGHKEVSGVLRVVRNRPSATLMPSCRLCVKALRLDLTPMGRGTSSSKCRRQLTEWPGKSGPLLEETSPPLCRLPPISGCSINLESLRGSRPSSAPPYHRLRALRAPFLRNRVDRAYSQVARAVRITLAIASVRLR